MQQQWWKESVVYQIWPRSFADGDGDGIGDLAGITSRLDYLRWLGVDAVWISPIFPSPMKDFGYDVSDYTGIHPLFGTLADFDRLLHEAHARDLQVILDFVPNHSSDQHPWFLESRSSRDNPKRDWYIWRDPAPDGGPPNDWQSAFGGSAWELDEQSGQYYFHAFLKEQPDLDWSNPRVRAAMADVLHFWLKRGVDGFRVDVIWLLAKGSELAFADSSPVASRGLGGDQPEVHEIIAGMRDVVDGYDDRLLIGEIYLPLERLVLYYGSDGRGLHLPFNFQLLQLAWRADVVHSAIKRYEELLPPGAWPNWVLANHDNPRVASRVAGAQARVAAVLLLTLRGTPTIYYGDEIGMVDVELPAEVQRDPQGLRGGRGRDRARTPMRWAPGVTAGFSTAEPWLPVGPAVAEINVATQRDEPTSMLTLYRRLLALRRAEAALSVGAWQDVGVTESVLAYLRRHEQRTFLVALNLGSRAAPLPPGMDSCRGKVVVSASGQRSGQPFDSGRELAGDEAIVVLLD